MSTPEPRWANRKQTAEYLRVHPRTVGRLAAAGTITAYAIGDTVRYNLNEIDAELRGTDPAELNATTTDVADVIARIRAALPTRTGRPLIPLAHVHAAIDKVAAELGVES